MNDRVVFFDHEWSTDTVQKALARSVQLNGELKDVNNKLSREGVELVNALEVVRDYLERPYHAENVSDALKTINSALAKWGRG